MIKLRYRKKITVIISFLFFLITILNVLPINVEAATMKIIVDKKSLNLSQAPVVINGTTVVPMRNIFEALGATVKWDASSKSITAKKGNTNIVLKIGATNAQINGKTVTLSQKVISINGNTMVPLRFVSESLGSKVSWDSKTNVISINSNSKTYSYDNLITAITENNLELVKDIIASGVNPNQPPQEGHYALLAATGKENVNLEIVSQLLNAGADPNVKDSFGTSPMVNAAYQNNIELARLILEYEKKNNIKDLTLEKALGTAVTVKYPQMVKLLLQYGANPNKLNEYGNPALFFAVTFGRSEEIVKILLEYGADPNLALKDGNSILYYASTISSSFDGKEIMPDPNIVQLLIDNDANPDNVLSTLFNSSEIDSSIVKLLLEAGANPNVSNYFGESLLGRAIMNTNMDILGLLLQNNADPNFVDNNGSKPLDYANMYRNSEAMNLLIQAGAIE